MKMTKQEINAVVDYHWRYTMDDLYEDFQDALQEHDIDKIKEFACHIINLCDRIATLQKDNKGECDE